MNITVTKTLEMVITPKDLLSTSGHTSEEDIALNFQFLMEFFKASRDYAQSLGKEYDFDKLLYEHLKPEIPVSKPDEWSYITGYDV